MNILLGITGSVAAVTASNVINGLREVGNVKVVTTKAAQDILNRAWKPQLHEDVQFYNDYTEWSWNKIGDPIEHIDLKDWADILVIAPLSANTLAKMHAGMCDNLLLSIYRAWQFKEQKPVVVAPAMNTDMWNNPLTRHHLHEVGRRHGYNRWVGRDSCGSEIPEPNEGRTISNSLFNYDWERRDAFYTVQPVEKKLACGVTGVGAMADIADIVQTVREAEKNYLKDMKTSSEKSS